MTEISGNVPMDCINMLEDTLLCLVNTFRGSSHLGFVAVVSGRSHCIQGKLYSRWRPDWMQLRSFETVGEMTWMLMVALMNIDDAYGKDLVWAWQRTSIYYHTRLFALYTVSLKDCLWRAGREKFMQYLIHLSSGIHIIYVIRLFWFLTKTVHH